MPLIEADRIDSENLRQYGEKFWDFIEILITGVPLNPLECAYLDLRPGLDNLRIDKDSNFVLMDYDSFSILSRNLNMDERYPDTIMPMYFMLAQAMLGFWAVLHGVKEEQIAKGFWLRPSKNEYLFTQFVLYYGEPFFEILKKFSENKDYVALLQEVCAKSDLRVDPKFGRISGTDSISDDKKVCSAPEAGDIYKNVKEDGTKPELPTRIAKRVESASASISAVKDCIGKIKSRL